MVRVRSAAHLAPIFRPLSADAPLSRFPCLNFAF